jgi:hypothetical protein
MVLQDPQHRASAGRSLVFPPPSSTPTSSATSGVESDSPSSVAKLGWVLCLVGAAIWLYGHNSSGIPSLFDWYSHTPWWLAALLPNMESETGTALVSLSALLIYWPARRQ